MKSNKYILIDGKTGKQKIITMTNTYDELHQNIDCRCFGVVGRKIGRKTYDIWHDDEFLFSGKNGQLTARCMNYDEVLLGNIVIARHDSNGGTIGLTDAEILDVQKNILPFGGREVLHYKL